MKNFLGEEYAAAESDSTFVVFPVPFEATTTYLHGCAEGPRAILSASWIVECYDEEAGLEAFREGIYTAPAFTEPCPLEELRFRLKERVAPWVEAGKFTVTLGGEHSVSLGPILAYQAKYPDLSVLHLDAHADLRDLYDGTPFSHACVMRRVQESCKVVQVGLRAFSAEEAALMPRLNTVPFLRKDARRLDDRVIRQIVSELTENVYFSCDIDGFDPAYAPATGTPEPGGLDWGEFSELLREVALQRRLVAMDVVEVKPNPGEVRTEFLAARVAYRTMSWVAKAGKR